MTRLRPISALMLALTMVISTIGFGIAHGQPQVTGQMPLCTGHGIVTVEIDADGQPVERIGICPDFAASILDLQIAAPIVAEAPPTRTTLAGLPVQRVLRLAEKPRNHPARAPPV